MKKRLLSMLMAVLMIVSLVPAVSADADCSHVKTADCVKNLSVKLDAAAKQPGIELYYCTEDDVVLSGYTITPFAEAKDQCPATKHNFVTVELQAASCVDRGVSVSYCSVCGTAAKNPVTLTKADDLGHTYSNFVVSVAPTCNTVGYGYVVCDVCGEPEFVYGPDAAVALMADDSTIAAKKAVEALYAKTNEGHKNTDVLVAATEVAYQYEWVEMADGDVGYLKATAYMWPAVAATHALTVNGTATVNGVKENSNVYQNAYAKMNVKHAYATVDTGWGLEATKYCPDCGEVVVDAKEVKGLNITHEMTLSQPGYYPYFDAENGVKHDGVSDVWYCKTCAAYIGGEVLPYADFFQYTLENGLPAYGCVVGDTWVVGADKPSCTKVGSTGTTYVLTKDAGWQVKTDKQEIPALGHDLVKVESKDATCQEIGWTCESYYVCANCDYHQGIAVKQAQKADHDYQAKVLVSATCKNTGLAVKACSWCGDLKVIETTKDQQPVYAERIKLAPCTAGEVVNAKEATCTEVGYTGDTFCQWCGKAMTTGKEIPMVDHTVVDVEAVAATCTEAGSTAGTKCSVCDKVLSGCEVVDALGHTYAEGVCTVCGAEDPDYVAPVVTPEFTDADAISEWAGKAVAWAAANGVVEGREDGSFDPQADVTRAEVAVMLYRLAGEPEVADTALAFADAADVPEWAVKAVAWAVSEGVVNGYTDNTFKANANITRAEFVQMLFNMKGAKVESAATFSDVVAGEWYVDAINWAVENDVTEGMGDGSFGVAANCSREQAVTFLFRLFAE